MAALLIAPGALAASGGPDGFGYTFTDAIAYNYISASGGSTIYGTSCNECVSAVAMPFAFRFYGADYSTVYVSSNGWISFTSPSGAFPTASAIPNAAGPNNLIAGWWADLVPGTQGGNVYALTSGTAPNRVFVVEFNGVQHNGFSTGGTKATFEFKLFETSNIVEVAFQGAPAAGSVTHASGIEDSAGSTGLEYFLGTAAGPTTKTVRYSPAVASTTATLSGTLGNNGWYTSEVTLSLACTPPNPPPGATCQPYAAVDGGAAQAGSSFAVGGEGTHTVSYYSAASTGGVEAAHGVSFKIDSAAPTVSAGSACSLAGNAGWCRGAVTVTTGATDATSGVGTVTCTLDGGPVGCGSVTVSADGAHTFEITAADNAGNTASASTSFTIDSIAPGASLAGRTPANGAGWNNGPVEVAWDCSDAGSGVVAAQVSATLSGEGDGQTATATCEDVAGNTFEASEGGIRIDLTPPA
ncbi:MAG TPA: hypothetical protein VGR28_04190, partial [Candidatus Thermoplasmatota archaeon]|nr:hypothetical protein [Candidatus Thermoplasmatota archaeon]